MAMDRDNKSMMMVQETAPFTAVDPCSKTSCGDLKSPRAVIMTGGGVVDTPDPQTLRGSFWAVSTPPIARVGAFFGIFRDLHDVHPFVPLLKMSATIRFSFKISCFFKHLHCKMQTTFNRFRAKF